MWRLWHKLFGWDYIQWSSAGLYGIASVGNNYLPVRKKG